MKSIRRSSRRTKWVAVGAALAMAVGGGAAWAYWTGGGSGTGVAGTATSVPGISVTQNTPTTLLTPGMSISLSGSLTNSNVTDVKVGALTAVVGALPTGVLPADFTISGTATYSSTDSIVKKGAPLTWSGLTLKYEQSAINQDAGKGINVPITYTLAAGSDVPVPVPPVTLTNGVLTVHYTQTSHVGTTGLHMYLKDPTSTPANAVSDWLQTTTGTAAVFNYTGSTFTTSPGSPATFGPIVSGHVYRVIITDPSGGFVLSDLPVTAS